MSARFGLFLLGPLLAATAGAVPVPEPPAGLFGGSPGRNPSAPDERGIPADWNVLEGEEKNLRWKARLGAATYGGGPVVAEGKVFVGTNNQRPRDPALRGPHGVLMCFDAATGKFLWQIAHPPLDETAYPTPCGGQGGYLASTPAVENGRIYYVSNRCELVCAETTRGRIVWSLDMIAALGVHPGGLNGGLASGSPLLLDDLVIVGTSNGVDADTRQPKNAKAPSLIAVNKTTGHVVWRDASPGEGILDVQWSSPAAAKVDGRWQVIHGGGDGWLRGFEARTGTLLWKFDLNPKGLVFDPNKRESKNLVAATPVVHENKVYVAVGQPAINALGGNGTGHLWCVDPARKPANAALDLSPAGDDFDPASPRNKDSGLVWHHGGAVVPKPAKGRVDWFGRTASTVAIHDGVVYAAELDGYLQALDAATGKKFWEADLEATTWSSPYHVDGKVFIGTEDGLMHVFQAGRALKRLGQIDMDAAIRHPPVAVDGVLYVSTDLYLYAVQAR